MNTIDRLRALAAHYGLRFVTTTISFANGKRKITVRPITGETGGAHIFLNACDKKAGIFTDGGVKHDPCLRPPHGHPRSLVGERIRMHEEYIAGADKIARTMATMVAEPVTYDNGKSNFFYGVRDKGACDCGCQHYGDGVSRTQIWDK